MKKFRLLILMMVLVMFGALSNDYLAAEFSPPKNEFFSFQGFWENFFGESDEETSFVKGNAIPKPKDLTDVDTANKYAENTAYGTDGTTEDQGTGVIELNSDLQGIVTEKEFTLSSTCSDGAGGTIDCVKPGDVISVSIGVKNTGITDDESVTVLDPLDTESFKINYQAADTVSLVSNVDNNTAMSISGGNTVGDLMSTGIVVDHVDSGDYFTLNFNVFAKADWEYDYYMTNVSQVCMPFKNGTVAADEQYNYVHGPSDSKDGTIFFDGTNYSLCSFGLEQVVVDGDNDGNITLPDLSWLNQTKVVKDASGDDVAQPGEELTYTIAVLNIGTVDKVVTVKDELNNPSLINVTFDDSELLVGLEGETTYTVGDLKTGFDVTLKPNQLMTFTFHGTVNDPIDETILEDGYIRNIAHVCESGTSDCDDAIGEIPVDPFTGKIRVTKDIDTGNSSDRRVVDTTGFGSGTVPSTKPTIKYKIKVENLTNNKAENVILKDVLPDESYLEIDRTQKVLVSPVDAPATDNDGYTAVVTPGNDVLTVADLDETLGGTGADIDLGAHDYATFEFNITISDYMYDGLDLGTDGVFGADDIAESSIFTNIAKIEWAGDVLEDSATGTIDGGYGVNEDFSVIKYDVEDLTVQGSNPENNTSQIDAGDEIFYNIELTNNSSNVATYNLYDPLDDVQFDTSDLDTRMLSIIDPASGLAAPTTGKFVTSYTDNTETTPTVANLIDDVNKPVYVRVPGKTTAVIRFSVKVDFDSAGADAINPDDKLINNVLACLPVDGAVGDFVDPECDSDSNIIDLNSDSGIEIVKTVNDTLPAGSPDGIASPGETLEYKIEVTNLSTIDGDMEYTLKDYADDPNLDYDPDGNGVSDEIVVNLDEDTDGTTTADISLTFQDLLDGYSSTPGTPDVGRGNTDTYTFEIDVLDPMDYVDAEYISNVACVQIGSLLSRKEGDTACDSADEPTGSDIVDNTDNFDVTKHMDAVGTDGVVDAGEDISVYFTVMNKSETDGVVKITEKNPLDQNIDWEASQANSITISSGEGSALVTSYTDTTAKSYTVADLVTDTSSTDPVIGSGMYVFVPALSSAQVSFTVKAKDSDNWVSDLDGKIINIANYCESTEATDCNDTDAFVPVVGFEDLTVTKNVEKAYALDSDGGTVDTITSGDSPYYYGVDDGIVDYRVDVINTGSVDFVPSHNLTFKDLASTLYFDYDPSTVPVDIVEYLPDGTVDSSSTGINTAVPTDVTLEDLNGAAGVDPLTLTGTQVFESGNTLSFYFTLDLQGNLNEFLDTNNTIPNIANICFDTVNNAFLDTGSGTVCYDAPNELPYQKPGETIDPDNPDDPEFSVVKYIDNDGNLTNTDQLEPGADTDFVIQVRNNDVDDSEKDSMILLTDEFVDENFNYEAIMGVKKAGLSDNGDIKIKDITTSLDSTFEAQYSYEKDFALSSDNPITDEIEGFTPSTSTMNVYNLLPKDVETEFTDGDAYLRWTSFSSTDSVGDRGGIWLKVPANHTYEIRFSSPSSGDLRTVTKIKDVLDVKKYFM